MVDPHPAQDDPPGKGTEETITPAPSTTTPPSLPPLANPKPKVTHLTDADLELVRTKLGFPHQVEGEPPIPKPSRFWQLFWPPHNLPPGLYKTVITNRYKSQVSYYFTSTLYNFCLLLQLLLGASTTALSSKDRSDSSSITILAAVNTVNAGLVALLHNSGLPNRIRNDWNEFEKVEVYMMKLLDAGVVEERMTRDDVIESAFRMFIDAKATVQNNKPAVYATAVKKAS